IGSDAPRRVWGGSERVVEVLTPRLLLVRFGFDHDGCGVADAEQESVLDRAVLRAGDVPTRVEVHASVVHKPPDSLEVDDVQAALVPDVPHDANPPVHAVAATV